MEMGITTLNSDLAYFPEKHTSWYSWQLKLKNIFCSEIKTPFLEPDNETSC